jgi:CRP-like cAMP-binding protein
MNSPADRETTCTWKPEEGGRCELDLNINILQSVSVFAPVPPERLKLYAYLSKRARYRAGDFIFRQGETDNRGYVLIFGMIQVIRELFDHSVLLGEIGPGDFFGGLSLLSNVQRLFSLRAVTDVECLTIDRDSFRKLLVQFPEVGMNVMDMMIQRVVEMEEKLLKSQDYLCLLP